MATEIKATLKCDYYDCEKEVEVHLSLKPGGQRIPIIAIQDYPFEWGPGEYEFDSHQEKDCCPEHKRK